MLTRDQFLDEIILECNICKHLFTKIPEGAFEYRPSAEQRSLHGLLCYLSVCGIMGTRAMIDSTWSSAAEYSARGIAMKDADFPAAMDRQIEELRAAIGLLTEEQLAAETTAYPDGTSMPISLALVKIVLKWFTAYRMQLFLYIKAAGVPGLNTGNCWAGVDWAVEEAEEKEGDLAG